MRGSRNYDMTPNCQVVMVERRRQGVGGGKLGMIKSTYHIEIANVIVSLNEQKIIAVNHDIDLQIA